MLAILSPICAFYTRNIPFFSFHFLFVFCFGFHLQYFHRVRSAPSHVQLVIAHGKGENSFVCFDNWNAKQKVLKIEGKDVLRQRLSTRKNTQSKTCKLQLSSLLQVVNRLVAS